MWDEDGEKVIVATWYGKGWSDLQLSMKMVSMRMVMKTTVKKDEDGDDDVEEKNDGEPGREMDSWD